MVASSGGCRLTQGGASEHEVVLPAHLPVGNPAPLHTAEVGACLVQHSLEQRVLAVAQLDRATHVPEVGRDGVLLP